MKYKLIKEPDNSLSAIQQILYNRGISLNQIHHYLNTSDLDINSFDGLGIENLKNAAAALVSTIQNKKIC